MIGHLYRYPHPTEPDKFLYVGQGNKRDKDHRSGRSSFGRRFKRNFPDVELPQPIREVVEIDNHLELLGLEIIHMFRYHTWYGYEGGMNLLLPGSMDYKQIGIMSGRVNVASGRIQALGRRTGKIQGRKRVESGFFNSEHQRRVGQIGGRISGRKNVERGFFNPEHQSKAGRIGGLIAGPIQGRKNVESGQLASIRTPENQAKGLRVVNCLRWRIRRNKSCICGRHSV